MKFKLDENIGRRGVDLLRARGHDVLTVTDQGLGGTTDDNLFNVCASEGRTLITLDHDFGQVPRFPPERSAGIIVLKVGPRATVEMISERMRQVLALLETHSVVGSLWIAEAGRVRIHLRNDEP